MNRFFDQDSFLMRALSKVFDIAYLSLVWLLFSLPIITIGASLTALYYATVKVLRRERGYVFGEFWRSFKGNFKQATLFWMSLLVILGLMVVNIQIVGQLNENYSGYLIGAYIAIALIVVATMCYIFPVLSRFYMKTTKLLRFSFYLAMKHILYTLILLVIVLVGALGFAIGVFIPAAVILQFFMPVLCTWLYSFIMERILKKYTPKSEEKKTEDGETITEWYME